MELGNEELFNIIQDQIQIGSSYELISTNMAGKFVFSWNPLEKWVVHPVYRHVYMEKDGFLFEISMLD